LDLLRAEIDAAIGPEDLAHLRKMERWGRACTALGYASAWIAPNPISALLIALGNTSRWAIVMHHVGHRGYDRVPGVPVRYTSRGFARGPRRFVDWLDWIEPESWRYEHNVLHHGRTGELDDPDLVEENVGWFRRSNMLLPLKYAVIVFFACTWKLSYYAPNTFQVFRWGAQKRAGVAVRSLRDEVDRTAAFDLRTAIGRRFWASSILPYGLLRFVVAPLLFVFAGWWAVFSVLVNSVLGELLANLHSFFLITPNHAGGDLFRFDRRAEDKETFYYRQVIGSANYATGRDWIDFLQGGLNYQIEHHLFPDLPLLKYQQYQARVKAICEKHGVPYVQESVFLRIRKFFDIVMARASMQTSDDVST
jgi:fatty acid desaturase